MATSPLSDVQHANFTILSLIRDAARADPGLACCRFGLTLAQLKAIGDLPPDGVMAVVAGLGNEALFIPREDLDRLIRLPSAVSSVLLSATAGLPAHRAQRSA